MRILKRRKMYTIKSLCVGLLVLTYACDKDNVGQPCGSSPIEPLDHDLISGETAVVEMVRLTRDSACETFQCLTHKGLPSYCTRHCSYESPSGKTKKCSQDSDCSNPLHCHAGICQDDDCPDGFWCRGIQEVGPLANQLFCVRKDNCKSNADCEDFGAMSCSELGCYDACLDPSKNCQNFHQLVCDPIQKLGCYCPDDGNPDNDKQGCADAELICRPEDSPLPWPAGAVHQAGVCLPK